MSDDVKLVHEALNEIKSMVTEKTKDIVTEEKFNKVSNDLIALQEKAQKAEQEALALKASIQMLGVQEGKANTDLEKKEHEAVRAYMANGSDVEIKTLGSYSQADGGITVPKLLSAKIIQKIYETSPIRTLASVETVSSDKMEFIIDDGEFSTGWTSETGTRSETNTAQLGSITIAVHEQYAKPKASQRILDDSSFNLEGWIANKVSEKFGRNENTAFVSGIGTDKPRGFLTYTAGTDFRTQIEQVNLGSSSDLTGTGLIGLQNSLKEEYQAGASWLMKRATYGNLLKLMYTDNKFNALNPLSINGTKLYLLGVSITLADDMPTIASNALSVAYGNFSAGYQILDRAGITLLRDPYSAKPFVEFYFTKRVGGDVINKEAIKIGKIAS